jgi:cell division protein FtsQ
LNIYSNTEICNLYSIISSNDFYQSLITQIDLQKNNVTLITRIKNFEINIGDLNMLETKFENLVSFYDRIIKFKGWDYYNKVNLKYVDQIICSKK